MSDRRCDRCCNGTVCGYRLLMNPPCAREVKRLERMLMAIRQHQRYGFGVRANKKAREAEAYADGLIRTAAPATAKGGQA